MKKGIHPKVYDAIYKDMSSDYAFLTTTTIKSNDTMVWPEDGKTYPVVKFEVTSASHPFFTGTTKIMDTEGRLQRFRNKYANAKSKK